MEIFRTQEEVLARIQELSDAGLTEEQMVVLYDTYEDLDGVEETDVSAIGVDEPTAKENVLDRFMKWARGIRSTHSIGKTLDLTDEEEEIVLSAAKKSQLILLVEYDAGRAREIFDRLHPDTGSYRAPDDPSELSEEAREAERIKDSGKQRPMI